MNKRVGQRFRIKRKGVGETYLFLFVIKMLPYLLLNKTVGQRFMTNDMTKGKVRINRKGVLENFFSSIESYFKM